RPAPAPRAVDGRRGRLARGRAREGRWSARRGLVARRIAYRRGVSGSRLGDRPAVADAIRRLRPSGDRRVLPRNGREPGLVAARYACSIVTRSITVGCRGRSPGPVGVDPISRTTSIPWRPRPKIVYCLETGRA